LCQLSNFDVFLVSAEQANRLKAPRPFVFALKSRLTRAHFEETSEWCHFVATKAPEEAASWVKSITEAGVRPSLPPLSLLSRARPHRAPG